MTTGIFKDLAAAKPTTMPMISRPISIKDAMRPGTNDWCISSDIAKSSRAKQISPLIIKSCFRSSFFLKDFKHKKLKTAYAGICARLETNWSVKDPLPKTE